MEIHHFLFTDDALSFDMLERKTSKSELDSYVV